MTYHQKLSDTNEDQLSLAAIHYLRSHFQEVRVGVETFWNCSLGHGDARERGQYGAGERVKVLNANQYKWWSDERGKC